MTTALLSLAVRDWDPSFQLSLPDGGDAVGWDVELTADLELVPAA